MQWKDLLAHYFTTNIHGFESVVDWNKSIYQKDKLFYSRQTIKNFDLGLAVLFILIK